MAAQSEEPPFDGGDLQAVRALRKEAKAREAAKNLAIRGLMADPNGRVWVWELLTACGIFHTAFSESPERMAFNCGQQNIGLVLLAKLMEVCPELYLVMQREQTEVNEDALAEPPTE